jgi:hypothetical protein
MLNLDDPEVVERLLKMDKELDEAYVRAGKFDRPSYDKEDQEWWEERDIRTWRP